MHKPTLTLYALLLSTTMWTTASAAEEDNKKPTPQFNFQWMKQPIAAQPPVKNQVRAKTGGKVNKVTTPPKSFPLTSPTIIPQFSGTGTPWKGAKRPDSNTTSQSVNHDKPAIGVNSGNVIRPEVPAESKPTTSSLADKEKPEANIPSYNSNSGNFTYGDGTQVRGTDPSGQRGRVTPDGVITYSDGSRASHDITSGDTKVTRPDGSVSVQPGSRHNIDKPASVDGPVMNNDTGNFTYGDGFQVRGKDPSGTRGEVGPGGIIQYSDGTRASHDITSGDNKVIRPDGSVTVQPGSRHNIDKPAGVDGPVMNNDTGNFTYGDGFQVRGKDPSGTQGEVGPGGIIQYSDGTRVSHDIINGDSKVVHPDGSVDVIPDNGMDGSQPGNDAPSYDKETGNFIYSDGVQVLGTDPNGKHGQVGPGGIITYSNGTRVSHDTNSGESKILRPDGTVEIRGGRRGNTSNRNSSGNRSTNNSTSRNNSARPSNSSKNKPNHDKPSNSGSDKPDNDKPNSSDTSGKDVVADKPSGKDTKGYQAGPGWSGGETNTTNTTNTASSPRLSVDRGSLATNPREGGGSGYSLPGGKNSPTSVPRSVGPGGRPSDDSTNRQSRGPRMVVDKEGLVTNPAGTSGGGSGSTPPLLRDPNRY